MKVSDEFWRPACRGYQPWVIENADHDIVLGGLSEAMARHICDLHNAEIVQIKRKFNAVFYRRDFWLITPTKDSGLHACSVDRRKGDTPAKALLAANAWYEANVENHP